MPNGNKGKTMTYNLMDEIPEDPIEEYLDEPNTCSICWELDNCECQTPSPRYKITEDAEEKLKEKIEEKESGLTNWDEEYAESELPGRADLDGYEYEHKIPVRKKRI